MRSLFILASVFCVGISIGFAGRAADALTDGVAPAAVEDKAAPHVSACSFIDGQEMSRILGGAVRPFTRDEPSASTTCSYLPAPGAPTLPSVHIKIDWQGGTAAMAGIRLADSLMGKDAGLSIADRIDGVSDEASMTTGGVMHVRQGPTVITIDLGLQPRAREKGTAIARAILARATEAAMTTQPSALSHQLSAR